MKISQSLNKTVLLLLFSLTSLQAGNLSGFQIGYSHNWSNSVFTKDDKEPGAYLGWDIMKTTSSGFGFGVGLDSNIWNADLKNSSTDSEQRKKDKVALYAIGACAKIGYTFQNHFDIPLKLKAGYGYGYGYDDNSNKESYKQYELSSEYTFFEGIGFGIKYKHAEATILTDETNVQAWIAYFSFSPLGN